MLSHAGYDGHSLAMPHLAHGYGVQQQHVDVQHLNSQASYAPVHSQAQAEEEARTIAQMEAHAHAHADAQSRDQAQVRKQVYMEEKLKVPY